MRYMSVQEAIVQSDYLENLAPKNRNCLRLLTEEMFSMAENLLGDEPLQFEIKSNGKEYSLCLSANTRIGEQAKKEFLSVSKSGENVSEKGVKGLISTVMEMFSYSDEYPPAMFYPMPGAVGGFSHLWTLSYYMENAPQEKVVGDWDQMEKSIIANFSDDVVIGVRSGKLEMIIKKTF